jgi:hypothetical protein
VTDWEAALRGLRELLDDVDKEDYWGGPLIDSAFGGSSILIIVMRKNS